jgi:hypothetical protein
MAHAGYSWGDYWQDPAMGGGELFDYSYRGLSYDAGQFVLAGRSPAPARARERWSTVVHSPTMRAWCFSIETTFPWEGK